MDRVSSASPSPPTPTGRVVGRGRGPRGHWRTTGRGAPSTPPTTRSHLSGTRNHSRQGPQPPDPSQTPRWPYTVYTGRRWWESTYTVAPCLTSRGPTATVETDDVVVEVEAGAGPLVVPDPVSPLTPGLYTRRPPSESTRSFSPHRDRSKAELGREDGWTGVHGLLP